MDRTQVLGFSKKNRGRFRVYGFPHACHKCFSTCLWKGGTTPFMYKKHVVCRKQDVNQANDNIFNNSIS